NQCIQTEVAAPAAARAVGRKGGLAVVDAAAPEPVVEDYHSVLAADCSCVGGGVLVVVRAVDRQNIRYQEVGQGDPLPLVDVAAVGVLANVVRVAGVVRIPVLVEMHPRS